MEMSFGKLTEGSPFSFASAVAATAAAFPAVAAALAAAASSTVAMK